MTYFISTNGKEYNALMSLLSSSSNIIEASYSQKDYFKEAKVLNVDDLFAIDSHTTIRPASHTSGHALLCIDASGEISQEKAFQKFVEDIVQITTEIYSTIKDQISNLVIAYQETPSSQNNAAFSESS